MLICAVAALFCTTAAAQMSAECGGMRVSSRDGRLYMQCDAPRSISVVPHLDSGAGLRGRLTGFAGEVIVDSAAEVDITDSLAYFRAWAGRLPQPLRQPARGRFSVLNITPAGEECIMVRFRVWCGYVSEYHYAEMLTEEGYLPVDMSAVIYAGPVKPDCPREITLPADMPQSYAAAVDAAAAEYNRKTGKRNGAPVTVVRADGPVHACDRLAVTADASDGGVDTAAVRVADGSLLCARINVGLKPLDGSAFRHWLEHGRGSVRVPGRESLQHDFLKSVFLHRLSALQGQATQTDTRSIRECERRIGRCRKVLQRNAADKLPAELRREAMELKYTLYESIASDAGRRKRHLLNLLDGMDADPAAAAERGAQRRRCERVWKAILAESPDTQTTELLFGRFSDDMQAHRWSSQDCCVGALCAAASGDTERYRNFTEALAALYAARMSDADSLVAAFARMQAERIDEMRKNIVKP